MTRTNKPYTLFINRRPIKVDYRTFICHCTRQFKGLQPTSVYNEFIRDFRFSSLQDIKDYILSITEGRDGTKSEVVHEILGNGFEGGIVEAAAAVAYRPYLRGMSYVLSDHVQYANALSLYINFNDVLIFSEAYKSLQPLTQFYHSLIFEVTEDDLVVRRNTIYPEDIDRVLKDLQSEFRFEDIQEDIEKHLLLLRFDDHYEWVSNKFARWLWKMPYPTIYRMNLLKLLTQIKYNVPPKRF